MSIKLFNSVRSKFLLAVCFSFAWILFGSATSTVAQESLPIWSEQTIRAGVGTSAGDCYFRKKFTLVQPESAELTVSIGGDLELYINNRLAHRSFANQTPITLDVVKFLNPGVNLIAVKARHASSLPIGFNAKLRIKEAGETRYRVLTTNDTWKVQTELNADWNKTSYNDINWLTASIVNSSQTGAPASGRAASVKPASANKTNPPESPEAASDQRFMIDPEFVIDEVLSPSETGSLIALEFNEFGKLLLSREGGPLLIADPSQPVGDPDRIRVYCKDVNTCQGILPLNGDVYVTAQGPAGLGLYLLSDENRDGEIDQVEKILGFTGGLGEHGPHGIQLGHDGMLYVILGNGTQVVEPVAKTSPYRNWYEGDLVPRYEDPGGHAVGVKAPGGTIIRLSLDGTKIERFAGGIRNAYDFVFDEQGELIVHDSDMESDVGAPWYRPNQVFHASAGAELGWRSGLGNFPMHAVDQTPRVCETGRGSPTGAVLYQHFHFPARYHDTVFLADWSEGKILSLHKQAKGSSFVATTEVFLSGKPLNVCDLAVGEDGGLYFCTGGRGTSGGVFRISWTGTVPREMTEFESNLAKVIRHPQINSAWARQNLAELSNQLGAKWAPSLIGVLQEKRNPAKFRIRALQLMVLYGSTPDVDLLGKIAADENAELRAEAAKVCGLNGSEKAATILTKLLVDDVPRVRRCAAEAFLRIEKYPPKASSLQKLLASQDRHEAMVARRLLERIPAQQWEEDLLKSTELRVFINASLALLTAEPSLERSYTVLARCSELFEGYLNDLDFLDLLRVTQLALTQGKVDPHKVPGLADRIANEFPSGNSIVNQELVRIMAYLKIGFAEGRVEEYLKSSKVSVNDRLHAAMYLQFVGQDLPPATRLAIIDCLETHRRGELSAGLKLYLKHSIEDAAKLLTAEQQETVIANGARWPNAVIPVFYQLPESLTDSTRAKIISLDQSLTKNQDPVSEQLRLGIIAILARSGDSESMEYLRQCWIEEEHRRQDIVIGLAQQPDQENWAYLVSSLSHLDDLTGREIVEKLTKVDRRPIEAPHFRELILLGYRMRKSGGLEAARLLQVWTGADVTTEGDWETQLDAWRNWFATQFPQEAPIELKERKKFGQHSVQGLLSYLDSNGLGDASRGQALFQSTQCATCHRHGSLGETIGPDLTNLAQRFSLREAVEATLDPSANIPDRYRSKIIITVDGDQHTGMALEQANGEYLILRSDGKKIRVLKEDIEDVKDSDISAMPDNLLDSLSVSEVADLMAFLMEAPDRTANSSSSTPR